MIKTFEIDRFAMYKIPLVVVLHHANHMKTLVYNPHDQRGMREPTVHEYVSGRNPGINGPSQQFGNQM
ncbi:hypothetical protein D3C81_1549950 [compost metagenome]